MSPRNGEVAEWSSARGGSAFGGKASDVYYVYVLKSIGKGRFYTGYTDCVEKRLKEHNSGKVRSTKAYVPYQVMYTEEYPDKTQARKREIFLKTGQGRKLLRELVWRGGRVVEGA